jgi:nitrite reductase/ring-hydroxylating ferredoxin subunit
MMIRIALALIFIVPLAAVGCGDGTTGLTRGIVPPTWIGAEAIDIEDNTLSIPASEVDSGKMIHFEVNPEEGDRMTFIAYKFGGKTYVRVSVCPPCGSEGFSLKGDTLDCDICHTKFNARTGKGISGECTDYQKADVLHIVSVDKITMGMDDLVIAHSNTMETGRP